MVSQTAALAAFLTAHIVSTANDTACQLSETTETDPIARANKHILTTRHKPTWIQAIVIHLRTAQESIKRCETTSQQHGHRHVSIRKVDTLP